MDVEKVMSDLKHLSFEDRLQLLEILSHSLREEWQPELRHETSSVHRVRGMLKPQGAIPTDAELQAAYTDYLTEKYS